MAWPRLTATAELGRGTTTRAVEPRNFKRVLCMMLKFVLGDQRKDNESLLMSELMRAEWSVYDGAGSAARHRSR